jgi:hypothetical protein
MSVLRSVFGPSKDEIWNQIAKDIGGQHVQGGFLRGGVLRYRSGEWEIALDTYSTGTEATTTHTRMRAPFVNKDGLYFSISREGLFSSIGKFFGMQDIQIGDANFDDRFVIKGNNEEKIRRLLNEPRLKQLIHAQPEVSFQIRDDDRWFDGQFPEGVDELYFECYGVVKDEKQLKNLFDLFSLTLQRLVQIDSAYEDDPGITL